MRQFTVPTLFTTAFLDGIAALNKEFAESGGQIYKIYCSFQEGAFNSARPAKYLPAVNRALGLADIAPLEFASPQDRQGVY